MTVRPRNFEFSCALYGKPDVAGYGHWHANVDSTTKGVMGMGTMLGMSCPRTFHVSMAGIKPGLHTFTTLRAHHPGLSRPTACRHTPHRLHKLPQPAPHAGFRAHHSPTNCGTPGRPAA